MGKESDFAAEAVEQSAEELPLIETIEGFVQGGCGGVEVDGGRDADDGVKLGGAAVPRSPASLRTRLPPME